MSISDIEVLDTDDRGRGVFATHAIGAGTTIVRGIPAACVPKDDRLRTHCSVCLAPAADRPLCSGCGHVVLCARCAKSDGARLIHDDECASLRSLFAMPAKERPADTCSLRLLLRLLLWRWRCSRPELPQYVEDEWWGDGDACGDELDDVMALCEPPEGLADGGVDCDAAFWDMAAQARYHLPAHARLSRGLAAELMARVYANGLCLYREDGGDGGDGGGGGGRGGGGVRREVGWGVSASVAMFNHRCAPNADWSIDADGCIVVRSVRPVRRGEELCLCYVDNALPRRERQARLREHFGFECQCEVCRAEEEEETVGTAGRASGKHARSEAAAPAPAKRHASSAPRARKKTK